MVFISFLKFFLFLRYLRFCLWPFGYVGKWLHKKVTGNFKIYDVTAWTRNNYIIYIVLENYNKSYELRVPIHKLRVQIHELVVQIHELQVQIHELED